MLESGDNTSWQVSSISAAFNVGLMAVLEYAMLEAADVVVVGDILKSLNPDLNVLPFIMLSLVFLMMNYRGV